MQRGVCLYATAEETGVFSSTPARLPFVFPSVTDISDSWRR